MDLAPKVEVAVDTADRCGEGPIWDAAGRRLIWTDIEGRKVYEFNPRTSTKSVFAHDVSVSGIGLNRTGDLVFGGGDGLFLWRAGGHRRTIIREVAGEILAFNDLIVGPRGRIYAGTIYWGPNGMEKRGRLYLIEPDCSARVVDDGIELANGLGFSPDDRTLYFTDSAARKIYSYDVQPDNGELQNKRAFVSVPGDEGIPDGLTVDGDGFVWSAQWYGAQAVRYDPEGAVERRVAVPVTQVSSLAFGGDDLTDLYITTAGETWRSGLAPSGYAYDAINPGGALFRIQLDIRGKPEHEADFSWE
jgi:D-xylono/L-arabinono-1,4-lactonase